MSDVSGSGFSDYFFHGTASSENKLTIYNLQLYCVISYAVIVCAKINLMRKDGDGDGTGSHRQELNDRILEINSLRTELERVRKDKNITSGLVTQMQKDMANKVLYAVLLI